MVKEPARRQPSQQVIEALYNEYELAHRPYFEGIRRVLGKENRKGCPALVLQFIDGKTLRDYLHTDHLGFQERLQLAEAVSKAVFDIHKGKIVHNDITSSNILVDNHDRSIRMIDFGDAIRRDGGTPVAETRRLKQESLPYLPPERVTNRKLYFDYRTDTYALGVVLYEILTGKLPFQAEDPKALFHEHVARKPTPPSLFNPDIPDALDRIILKLLAKDPEERYQSAFGLLSDLKIFLDRILRNQATPPFPLGRTDHSSVLKIPDKLYGRERQISRLRERIEETGDGGPKLVLVYGYAGIGKTVLVQQMRRPIVSGGGLFLQGKAEQYRSSIPYTIISTAFRDLMHVILSKSERELARWKEAISAALGDQSAALAEIVPGLDKILGMQKDIAFLGGQEAHNRLRYLIRSLVSTLLQLASPLVVFLDDLQWIDTASLNLLRALFADRELAGLCVIGAYRDNEVDEGHPLSAFLTDMENRRTEVTRIVLENLDINSLSSLVADTFGPTPGIDVVSELLFEKTLGNPFFAKQLLFSLNECDQIRFNIESQRWEWEIEALQALDISENVVEYLTSTIQLLDPETQDLLQLGAAFGIRFDPSLLAKLRGETAEDVIRELQKPETMQLLYKRENNYRFVHDRIHQAIYGLMDDDSKSRFHLEIGRMLLNDLPEEQKESSLFKIVDHLNIGASLVSDRDERNHIARQNHEAARKARDSAAFAAMLRYVQQGIQLLGANSWQTSYDLSLGLHTMASEAEYLNTNFEAAQERAQIVFDRARDMIDKITAYEIVMMCCFARYRMDEAINIGRSILSMLGVNLLTAMPPTLEVEQFRRLPIMTDSTSLAGMRILTMLFPPAMIAVPELLPRIVFTLIDQCLRNGNSSYSAFTYALYGMYLCENPEGTTRGNQFGKLALHMLESTQGYRMENRVRELVHIFIEPWESKHLYDSMEDMRQLAQSAIKSGETEIACNQWMSICILLVFVGEPMEAARQFSMDYVNRIGELKQGFQLKLAKAWAQLLINLSGMAENATQLIGPYFDESHTLQRLAHEHGLTNFYCYMAIAMLHFFTGDFEESVKYMQLSAGQQPRLFGFPVAITHATYHALAMLQHYDVAGEAEKQKYLKTLDPIRSRLKALGRQGSINFEHDHYLIEAEIARVDGDSDRALRFYEKAISTAKRNRFPNFEAISCDLAGRFCLDQDLEGPARYYLNRAYDLYQQWGLMLKVRELEQSYADLLEDRGLALDEARHKKETVLVSGRPDLASALKALRTLSSETELKTLLNRMMGIVIEHAGAEKGVLVLRHGDHWYIQATGDFQKRTYDVLLNLPFSDGSSDREDNLLPSSVVNLCLRSEESLIIDNALSDNRFSSDPYVIRHRVKSALCVPMRYQGRLNGALYLENRHTVQLFGHIKVEILQLLCTQFSISFENALLYEALQERLRFERLVSGLSAAFVNMPVTRIGRQFSLWLRKLVTFLETDRGAVYEYSSDRGRLVLKQYYAGSNIPKPPSPMTRLPWYARRIAVGRTVILRNTDELPAGATAERLYFQKQGIRSYIAVPMSVGGSLLGVIEFASFHRENDWNAEVVDRLRLIEEIFAQALKRRISEKTLQRRTAELKESAVKLKKLTEHLQEVREHERANIAREIHDELGQVLTVLRMDTSWVGRHIRDDPAVLTERLHEMIGLIDSATDSVQSIARELRPQMLDVLGLFDAIEWQVREFQRREGITCRTIFEGEEIEEENTVIVLFRIVQEALTNVARHAHAEEVTVCLEVDKGCIILEVVDNGQGITEEQVISNRSLGLIGMRERVSFLNGKMEITGKKGQGTRLRVTLPVEWKP